MHESCGKCTPCREGTRWMARSCEKIEDGRARRRPSSTCCSTSATGSRASASVRSATPPRSPSPATSQVPRRVPGPHRRRRLPLRRRLVPRGLVRPGREHTHSPVPRAGLPAGAADRFGQSNGACHVGMREVRNERGRARHGHDRRAHGAGSQGHRAHRDRAGGRDRDPGLLLRAPARPARRRLPDVPRRGRGDAEAPGRLHADRAGRDGRASTARTSAQAARGAERHARVHPRQPSARLPGLRQGRRVPAAGPDLPLRARQHADPFPKRTFEKPIPISPPISLDRERCILCYRCTRF